MDGEELSGTCRTCIIAAALFAGLFPNAQLTGQVARNEVGQVKTGEAGAAEPGAAFRDCPECPENGGGPGRQFHHGFVGLGEILGGESRRQRGNGFR